MISLTAEYALRAVVWMACRPDAAVGTRDIAEATQVPVGYLSKVLQALARAGLVRSRPGRGGGFLLARRPAAIRVLDVVQAVDPIRRIERCPLGLRRHDGKLCPLHRRLDQTAAMVERAFAESTISELSEEAPDDKDLCTYHGHATAAPQTSAAGNSRRRPGRSQAAKSVRQRPFPNRARREAGFAEQHPGRQNPAPSRSRFRLAMPRGRAPDEPRGSHTPAKTPARRKTKGRTRTG
ncbi:MAG: Rrf2 family transcriptional regulator [Planctomycetes bacterium]|nr:Rrf2 family transcriptional regulator [Planctomycetota bacterium]